MTDDFKRVRRRLRLAVVGMALGMFLAVLSQTVVATAMPTIIVDLGGFGRYAWVATAYLVAATVTMPIAGRIADIYGSKRVLLAGIVLVTVASIPAGLSQTLNQLVAYRALQGIGGGVVMMGSLVGMAQLFPPARRTRYQALVAAVYALASVLGPALGGFVTDAIGWSWVFLRPRSEERSGFRSGSRPDESWRPTSRSIGCWRRKSCERRALLRSFVDCRASEEPVRNHIAMSVGGRSPEICPASRSGKSDDGVG